MLRFIIWQTIVRLEYSVHRRTGSGSNERLFMPKWLASLQGNEFDLSDLPKLFVTTELAVSGNEDGYYLTSSDFDALTSNEDVFSRAHELLMRLNGVAKVCLRNYKGVHIDEVVYDYEDGTFQHFGRLHSEATIRTNNENNLSDGSSPSAHQAGSWISLSHQKEEVIDVLNFFQEEPTTWWSLRKVYEVITNGRKIQAPTIEKKKWASRQDVEQFRRWADYYVHGELKDPPKDTPPMSLEQAESFVRGLLKAWLSSKADTSP